MISLPKVKVKLAPEYSSYNEVTSGFYINSKEEKEVPLYNSIKILIEKKTLIIV